MKVKDLVKALQALDQDMVIEFADRYERSEGWEDDCEDASVEIACIREHDGKYIMEDEDYYHHIVFKAKEN